MCGVRRTLALEQYRSKKEGEKGPSPLGKTRRYIWFWDGPDLEKQEDKAYS
jgi:hypothetical protein